MKKLYPLAALAEALDISQSTVRVWLKRGVFPEHAYIKVDTTYRFDVEAIVEHLKTAPKDIEGIDLPDFSDEESDNYN